MVRHTREELAVKVCPLTCDLIWDSGCSASPGRSLPETVRQERRCSVMGRVHCRYAISLTGGVGGELIDTLIGETSFA
jgi:hypothetical protein